MLFLRLFTGCLLQLFPFSIICLYPFENHFRFHPKKVIYYAAVLLTALSLIFAFTSIQLTHIYSGHMLFDVVNIVFMFCLVPCFISYFYITEDIPQKRIFIFLFTLTIALIMTSLNNTICHLLPSGTYASLPYSGYAIPVLAGVTLITVPIILLILKTEFRPLAEFLYKDDYNYLCVLSAVLFLLLAGGLVSIDYSYLYQVTGIYLYSTLIITVFMIYFMVFRTFRLAKERVSAERKLAQSESLKQLQTEQYRHLQQQISETRRSRHDSRHRLLALRKYIENNDIEGMLSYIDEQVEHLDRLTIDKYSENEIVNVVVSHFSTAAKRENIKTNIKIGCKQTLSISDTDLSVLLGNLLENAVYNAGFAEETYRYITLHILQKGNMLAVTVDNGFDGEITCRNNTYISRKTNHTGYGLSSISQIAEKYGGAAEFFHEGYVFHASVFLHV